MLDWQQHWREQKDFPPDSTRALIQPIVDSIGRERKFVLEAAGQGDVWQFLNSSSSTPDSKRKLVANLTLERSTCPKSDYLTFRAASDIEAGSELLWSLRYGYDPTFSYII